MNHRLEIVGALIATLGLPAIGSAQPDKLLCDAMGMLAQSRMLACTARCMQRASLTHAGKGSMQFDPNQAEQGCFDPSNTCQQRYADALTLSKQTPACGGHYPPDPEKCAAKLYSAQANRSLCQFTCAVRADRQPNFDQQGCNQGCEHAYQAKEADILAMDICSDGPSLQ